ncbi:response regulator [Hydrogenophaga sp.]|uniref:response regulator n=1 Tax=Hydrogenophaga sp. TaxID=1904254 RepID=UPI00286DA622|nr:response regulator [Hydrogenophaga sp.]
MNALAPSRDILEVCGTLHASKLLGLSVGSVQDLVEKGELKAWKTRGGHRRIFMHSVRDFQRTNGLTVCPAEPAPPFRILVVDDDQSFLRAVKAAIKKWKMDVDCTTMASPIEALMSINAIQPRIMLMALAMPKFDGSEFIKQLRSNKQFDAMHLVALASPVKSPSRAHVKLPLGVLLASKPVDLNWLQGYVAAVKSKATKLQDPH